jgi:hypothetical protein
MKKRYIFPLVCLVIELSIFIVPVLFPVVYIVSIPSMLIVNSISRSLNGPVDTYYLINLATLIEFFLLGYLWDLIAAKIKS